jgi:DNA polymerase III delta prime subunit
MPAARPRLPLAERLRPVRLDDVIGNSVARAHLKAWADRWVGTRPPAQRAALLSGPPGVGKTSAALALANDLGWSVVEMNASDARNERAIDQVAGRASITHTLVESTTEGGAQRALILLDEADSLSGRATESARAAPSPPVLREFLRGRYPTVDALNAAWGLKPGAKPTPFDSWDDLPRSPGNFAWGRLAPARRDIDDWRGASKPRDSSDRGGMGAIARLVRSTRQPLVLTVNDERPLTRYSAVFRTSVARIRFGPIRDPEMAHRLAAIARQEKIELAAGALDAIVTRAHGDLRAALNDLDAISPIRPGPVQLSLLGSRDIAADFEAVTEEALTAARYFRSGEIRDRLDAPPDDLFPWVEENLPFFAPDPVHRAAAFDRLASAERQLARARRFRVWGLWSYASELMTGGVGLALRDAPGPAAGRAQFPRFLGEMGRSKGTRAVREGVVRKAGARFHLSRRKTRDEILPFLENLFTAVRRPAERARLLEIARRIAHELDLTAEEIGYLAEVEPDSALVDSLLGPSEASETRGPPREAIPGLPTADEGPPSPDRRPVQRQLSDFGTR